MTHKTSTTYMRRLKPGEKTPDGSPRRSLTFHGYVLLTWTDPDRARGQVCVLEHRVFDGYVTTAENVHHINGVRDDNRPENLMQLTAAEHIKLHHPGDYHGTSGGYSNHKCRCAPCTEAWATYHRLYMRRHRLRIGRKPRAVRNPAPPGPKFPKRIAQDYCRTCGCAGWHWAGCPE